MYEDKTLVCKECAQSQDRDARKNNPMRIKDSSK